jgi:hypothetical protein
MKNSCKRTWLLAALASLAATPVWADGELDASFGSNGIVRVAFPGSSRGYLRDVAVVNGLLEAAGYERESEVGGSFFQGCSTPFPDIFIVKLSLSGAVIGSPSSHEQQTIRCPSSLLVDSATGDIYVTGYVSSSSQEAAVAKFDSNGSLVASYTSGDGGICEPTRILLDNQNRLVAPCRFNAGLGPEPITAMRLSAQGGQLTGGFLARSRLPSVYRMSLSAITQDVSSGAYYVGAAGDCLFANGCPVTTPDAPAQFVIRLNADSGTIDTNYGRGGVAAVFLLPRGELHAITLDDSGNVLIGGDGGGMDVGLVSPGYVARFDPSGTPDLSFGAQGIVQNIGDSIVDVRTDDRGRVYALGSTSELLRFRVKGALDVVFSSSNVQTLNGAGSSWQSLQFADNTRSSAYLLGGAAGCTSCTNAAATAVIAKVNLDSGSTGPGPTLTTLSLTATAIKAGQSVTLMASVSGINPTGTVTFKDGAITLGSPVALTASKASYSTSALVNGSHSISAAYSGDSQNMASTSQVVVETVTAAPLSSGGSTSSGGGGSFAVVDLCTMLLVGIVNMRRRLVASSALCDA